MSTDVLINNNLCKQIYFYDIEVPEKDPPFVGVLTPDGTQELFWSAKSFYTYALEKSQNNSVFIGFNTYGYDNIILNEWMALETKPDFHYSSIRFISNYVIHKQKKPSKPRNKDLEERQKAYQKEDNDYKQDKNDHDEFIKKRHRLKNLLTLDLRRVILGATQGSLKTQAYRLDYRWKTYSESECQTQEERISYNLDDLLATKLLYEKGKGDVDLLLEARDLLGITDCYSDSPAGLARAYAQSIGIGKEYTPFDFKRDIINPLPNSEIKDAILKLWDDKNLEEVSYFIKGIPFIMKRGGLHYTRNKGESLLRILSSENRFVYNIDFASFYPALYTSVGFLSEMVATQLKQMMNDRIALKKTNPLKAKVYKLILNSLFGNFKHLNIPIEYVTLIGQYIVSELAERCLSLGMILHDVNTDGVTVEFFKPLDEETLKELGIENGVFLNSFTPCQKLPIEVDQIDEAYYKDSNNYLYKINKGWKSKGSWLSNIKNHDNFNLFDITPFVTDSDETPPTRSLVKHSETGEYTEYHLTPSVLPYLERGTPNILNKQNLHKALEKGHLSKDPVTWTDKELTLYKTVIHDGFKSLFYQTLEEIPFINARVKERVITLNRLGLYTSPKKEGKRSYEGIPKKAKEETEPESHNVSVWGNQSKASCIALLMEQGLWCLDIDNKEAFGKSNIKEWVENLNTIKTYKNGILNKVFLKGWDKNQKVTNKSTILKHYGIELLTYGSDALVYDDSVNLDFEGIELLSIPLTETPLTKIITKKKETIEKSVHEQNFTTIQTVLEHTKELGFNFKHKRDNHYIAPCITPHEHNDNSKVILFFNEDKAFISCSSTSCEWNQHFIPYSKTEEQKIQSPPVLDDLDINTGEHKNVNNKEDNKILTISKKDEITKKNIYPTQAFGSQLSKLIDMLHYETGAALETCGTSILGFLSTAMQMEVGFCFPYDRSNTLKPVSLFTLIICESGDRKTTVDNQTMSPLNQVELELHKTYKKEKEEFQNYEKLYKKIEEQRIKDIANNKQFTKWDDAKNNIYKGLEEKKKPICPFLKSKDPTPAALFKHSENSYPFHTINSSEGGQFFKGFGFSKEQLGGSISAISDLWDGGAKVQARKTDDAPQILSNFSLTLNMMVQEKIIEEFITNPLVKDQGILSRLLICKPTPIFGTPSTYRSYERDWEEFEQETNSFSNKHTSLFLNRMKEALQKSKTYLEQDKGEVRKKLKISEDSIKKFNEIYNYWNGHSNNKEGIRLIKEWAAKAPEQVMRISAILEQFENPHCKSIQPDTLRRANDIVLFYAREFYKIVVKPKEEEISLKAQEIVETVKRLQKESKLGNTFSLRDLKIKIRMLKDTTKDRVQEIVHKIEQLGLFKTLSPGKYQIIKK